MLGRGRRRSRRGLSLQDDGATGGDGSAGDHGKEGDDGAAVTAGEVSEGEMREGGVGTSGEAASSADVVQGHGPSSAVSESQVEGSSAPASTARTPARTVRFSDSTTPQNLASADRPASAEINPMMSVRIVYVEHYMAEPLRRDSVKAQVLPPLGQQPREPVIRIFGSTPVGQKVCVHLHGACPYLFLALPELGDPAITEEMAQRYMNELHDGIERAVAATADAPGGYGVSGRRRTVKTVSLHKGLEFFGYSRDEIPVAKIVLFDPSKQSKVTRLLADGHVMSRKFQPHEAHVPFMLQVFADYNLAGMGFVHLANLKFRGPMPTRRVGIAAARSGKTLLSTPPIAVAPSSVKSPHSVPGLTVSQGRVLHQWWFRDNTPQSSIWLSAEPGSLKQPGVAAASEATPEGAIVAPRGEHTPVATIAYIRRRNQHVLRQTTCELELDAWVEDVLNPTQRRQFFKHLSGSCSPRAISGAAAMSASASDSGDWESAGETAAESRRSVMALAAWWQEEAARRRTQGLSSQFDSAFGPRREPDGRIPAMFQDTSEYQGAYSMLFERLHHAVAADSDGGRPSQDQAPGDSIPTSSSHETLVSRLGMAQACASQLLPQSQQGRLEIKSSANAAVFLSYSSDESESSDAKPTDNTLLSSLGAADSSSVFSDIADTGDTADVVLGIMRSSQAGMEADAVEDIMDALDESEQSQSQRDAVSQLIASQKPGPPHEGYGVGGGSDTDVSSIGDGEAATVMGMDQECVDILLSSQLPPDERAAPSAIGAVQQGMPPPAPPRRRVVHWDGGAGSDTEPDSAGDQKPSKGEYTARVPKANSASSRRRFRVGLSKRVPASKRRNSALAARRRQPEIIVPPTLAVSHPASKLGTNDEKRARPRISSSATSGGAAPALGRRQSVRLASQPRTTAASMRVPVSTVRRRPRIGLPAPKRPLLLRTTRQATTSSRAAGTPTRASQEARELARAKQSRSPAVTPDRGSGGRSSSSHSYISTSSRGSSSQSSTPGSSRSSSSGGSTGSVTSSSSFSRSSEVSSHATSLSESSLSSSRLSSDVVCTDRSQSVSSSASSRSLSTGSDVASSFTELSSVAPPSPRRQLDQDHHRVAPTSFEIDGSLQLDSPAEHPTAPTLPLGESPAFAVQVNPDISPSNPTGSTTSVLIDSVVHGVEAVLESGATNDSIEAEAHARNSADTVGEREGGAGLETMRDVADDVGVLNRAEIVFAASPLAQSSNPCRQVLKPSFAPPSLDCLLEAAQESGIEPVENLNAFFGDDADVPSHDREYGGRRFKLRGDPSKAQWAETGGDRHFYDETASVREQVCCLGKPHHEPLPELKQLACIGHGDRVCVRRSLIPISGPPGKHSIDTWVREFALKQRERTHGGRMEPVRFDGNTGRLLPGRAAAATRTPDSERKRGRARLRSQVSAATPTQAGSVVRNSQQGFRHASHAGADQHVTLLSLELHINTRGKLRPDPDSDEVCALVYAIHDDHVVGGTRTPMYPADAQTPSMHTDGVVRGMIVVNSSIGKACRKSRDAVAASERPVDDVVASAEIQGRTASKQGDDDEAIEDDKGKERSKRYTSITDAHKSAAFNPAVGASRIETSATKLYRVAVEARGSQFFNDAAYFAGKRVDIKRCESEVALINSFVALVHAWDPDMLVGYEMQQLSLGYLIARARQHSIRLSARLSRVPGEGADLRDGADDWGDHHGSGIWVRGRTVLNLWRLMRSEVKLNRYTVENVVKSVLNERMPAYSHECLTNWFTGSARTQCHVVQYYVDRAVANLRLLDHLDLIGRTSEMARLFGIDFFSVLTRGSQYRVEAVMLRVAKPSNYVLVSPTRNQVASQDALSEQPMIMEPMSAFYTSPVVVLDFQSLYPSLIIAYNMCYSTCLGCVSHSGMRSRLGFKEYEAPSGELKAQQKELFMAPNGAVFASKSRRLGLLPRMLEEILETRVMTKRTMKQADVKGDPVMTRILHARQFALKMLANVTYGYTSASFSGRMPCVHIADAIVSTGRATLRRAMEYVSSVEEWNAEVVYGDTDSMFVHLPGRSKEDALRIGHEIAAAVSDMNPRPVTLKFEKVYFPCVLPSKKRYVGYMFESAQQTRAHLDCKGIEIVRRDTCPVVAKTMEKSLRLLFETRDLSQVKSYLQRQWAKMRQGRVHAFDFIFAKEVRLGSYSERGVLPPSAYVATKLMQQDRRAEPRYRERIPYVVVHSLSGKERLTDMVVSPDEFMAKRDVMRLNMNYYITKQIIPALERIFNLLGADVRAWYAEMKRPRTQRLARVPKPSDGPLMAIAGGALGASKAPGQHARPSPMQRREAEEHAFLGGRRGRGTMFEYFASELCELCGESTQQSICDDCLSDSQRFAFVAMRRLAVAEQALDHLAAVCHSCERQHEDFGNISCKSLDCIVYFERCKAADTRLKMSDLCEERGLIEADAMRDSRRHREAALQRPTQW